MNTTKPGWIQIGQNTKFIYRTVPGIASNRSNILRNVSLQFTRILLPALAFIGFLHERGFLRL